MSGKADTPAQAEYWIEHYLIAWAAWLATDGQQATLGYAAPLWQQISGSSDLAEMYHAADAHAAEAIEAIVRHDLTAAEAMAVECTYCHRVARWRREGVEQALLRSARGKILSGLRKRHIYCGE